MDRGIKRSEHSKRMRRLQNRRPLKDEKEGESMETLGSAFSCTVGDDPLLYMLRAIHPEKDRGSR